MCGEHVRACPVNDWLANPAKFARASMLRLLSRRQSVALSIVVAVQALFLDRYSSRIYLLSSPFFRLSFFTGGDALPRPLLHPLPSPKPPRSHASSILSAGDFPFLSLFVRRSFLPCFRYFLPAHRVPASTSGGGTAEAKTEATASRAASPPRTEAQTPHLFFFFQLNGCFMLLKVMRVPPQCLVTVTI